MKKKQNLTTKFWWNKFRNTLILWSSFHIKKYKDGLIMCKVASVMMHMSRIENNIYKIIQIFWSEEAFDKL